MEDGEAEIAAVLFHLLSSILHSRFRLLLFPLLVQLEHRGGEHALVIGQERDLVGADVDDDVVAAREVVLEEAEGFAEEALDAVALGGGSDFSAYAQAQAGMIELVGESEESEGAAGFAGFGGVDGV